jgi:hypothetical protein
LIVCNVSIDRRISASRFGEKLISSVLRGIPFNGAMSATFVREQRRCAAAAAARAAALGRHCAVSASAPHRAGRVESTRGGGAGVVAAGAATARGRSGDGARPARRRRAAAVTVQAARGRKRRRRQQRRQRRAGRGRQQFGCGDSAGRRAAGAGAGGGISPGAGIGDQSPCRGVARMIDLRIRRSRPYRPRLRIRNRPREPAEPAG